MVLPTKKQQSPIGPFAMKNSPCFSMLLVAALICVAWFLLPPAATTDENFFSQITPNERANIIDETTRSLDLGKVCPNSLELNQINDHLPPSELLEFDEIHSVLKYWHTFNCPRAQSCTFTSIGQHLLHHAINEKKTLLTVQVGAMNGRTNDPMHEMFFKPSRRNPTSVVVRDSFLDLRNWLPVMIEPVPINYKNLLRTYDNIVKTKHMGCTVPINAAASYEDASKTVCPFCRINTADDAPEQCKNFPDWKRLQLGSLECDHLKEFLGYEFDLCVIQDPLPCSSVSKLLSDRSIPSDSIAILQVDVEGYEYSLLRGFLEDIADRSLPPIIHFEHKILRDLSQLDPLKKLLESKGYVLHEENHNDSLAFRFGSTSSSS